MRIENLVSGTLEKLWGWTWSMDHRNSVASYKRDDWRLLDEDFKSKPIKREGKTLFQQFKTSLNILNIFTV